MLPAGLARQIGTLIRGGTQLEELRDDGLRLGRLEEMLESEGDSKFLDTLLLGVCSLRLLDQAGRVADDLEPDEAARLVLGPGRSLGLVPPPQRRFSSDPRRYRSRPL